MIVSESMFWERPVHRDTFPIQFKMFMQDLFFWTGFEPSAISVNDINESKYGFLIEF